MAALVYLLLLLGLTGYSSGLYCLCRDGVSTDALQKALDYACANGADCSQIQSNGVCFQPNTIKDHCSYAVNSYYQKKVQSGATCEFSGSATPTPNPPSGQVQSCVYPSSTSTTSPGTTTPTTPTPPSTITTPSTTLTPPSTTTTGGTTFTPPFGGGGVISPSGNVFDNGTGGLPPLPPAWVLIISSALLAFLCSSGLRLSN